MLATEALSISWQGVAVYTFPPISLLHRVLASISRETCAVLLIVLLVSAAMVSATAASTGGSAKVVSNSSRSSVNASVQGQIPQRQRSSFNCLAAIKRRYRNTVFSVRSTSFFAQGRRASTLIIYAMRLRPYVGWCRRNRVSPN